MDPKMTPEIIHTSFRIVRLEAVADMAIMAQKEMGQPLPDGDTLKRILLRVDHAAALAMNEAPTDTAKRRRLTDTQERAMEYLGRLHTDGLDDPARYLYRPTLGTLCALIRRGLITTAPSGRMEDHQLTDAGWAHLGM